MKQRDGFTLIEILVVMGIMSLLAGLLMGGLNAAKGKAKKTQAKKEVSQIVTAWTAYYGDYKRFPDVVPNGSGETSYTITEMGRDAIRILQGNYHGDWAGKNTRNTVYLDFHKEYTDQSDFNGYNDPWGNIYQVRLDKAPYDGEVSIPSISGLKFSAVAWSMGPDEVDGTSDDVRSWEKR